MPYRHAALILAGLSIIAPAFAQRPDTPVAALPAPNVDENAAASEFLKAAERALAAGRNGEAQQAMEMAQTRLLDRSVPMGQTDRPSDHPAIGLVREALQALAAGDRGGSLAKLQAAQAAIAQ